MSFGKFIAAQIGARAHGPDAHAATLAAKSCAGRAAARVGLLPGASGRIGGLQSTRAPRIAAAFTALERYVGHG